MMLCQIVNRRINMSKIDNKIALDEIMLSIEKTQALVSQVKRLALDVTAHKTQFATAHNREILRNH